MYILIFLATPNYPYIPIRILDKVNYKKHLKPRTFQRPLINNRGRSCLQDITDYAIYMCQGKSLIIV